MSRSGGDGADWLDQLEAKLEQTLEAFLRSNPGQRQRLHQQMQADAQALRRELLQLAAEIQRWRDRVTKARAAGAPELAAQAQHHVDQLMEQGRSRWQRLEQLGQELQGAEAAAAKAPPTTQTSSREPLDQAWARFEIEQDLERLRRRR
jgi:hercynine metabolism protein